MKFETTQRVNKNSYLSLITKILNRDHKLHINQNNLDLYKHFMLDLLIN